MLLKSFVNTPSSWMEGVFYLKADIAQEELSRAQQARMNPTRLGKDINKIALNVFGQEPCEFLILGEGTFHIVFAIKLQDGIEYILRIGIPGVKDNYHEFFLDEWIYSCGQSKGIPLVESIYTDFSKKIAPFEYQILEKAQGVLLSKIQDHETQFISHDILFSLGATIAKVHQVKLSGYGPILLSMCDGIIQGQGKYSRWIDFINTRLEEHCAICLQQGFISHQEINDIFAIFKRYEYLFTLSESSLLHNDLGGHNVFTDYAKIIAIIDWEDCLAGDPIFDMANWGTFYRDYLREDFLQGYQSIGMLPDDFEIRYWLYYLRISLAKTVSRYRFGIQDVTGRNKPSLRIQKALGKLNFY